MKKVILILLVFILAACSAGGSGTSSDQQKWEDANISHYRFELTLSCFCAFRDQMPLTIEVKDGEVVSMTFADGQTIPSDDPNFEFFKGYGTMDNIFEKIEGAQADPEAGEVTVTYDPIIGYPVEAAIDYIEMLAWIIR